MNWYLEVLKKYAVFSGRARRKEYWMFVLINILISVVLTGIAVGIGIADDKGNNILSTIYSLAILIPSIAVGVRRLHDTDRSGWWLLIAFVPCIGGIVLLVFAIQEGTNGENEYGENPKAYE